MIWRKSVQTKLVENWSPTHLSFTTLGGQQFDASEARLITFGWSLESLSGQEVWRRLAQGDFGPEGLRRCLVVKGRDDPLVRELDFCLTPSEKQLFLLVIDPQGSLKNDLDPEREEVCCAWHPAGRVVAIGMATEEAWEGMAESLTLENEGPAKR